MEIREVMNFHQNLILKKKYAKKIEEIEQSKGKRLKHAAKTIIEAYTTGDETQKKKIEEKIRGLKRRSKKAARNLSASLIPSQDLWRIRRSEKEAWVLNV